MAWLQLSTSVIMAEESADGVVALAQLHVFGIDRADLDEPLVAVKEHGHLTFQLPIIHIPASPSSHFMSQRFMEADVGYSMQGSHTIRTMTHWHDKAAVRCAAGQHRTSLGGTAQTIN